MKGTSMNINKNYECEYQCYKSTYCCKIYTTYSTAM